MGLSTSLQRTFRLEGHTKGLEAAETPKKGTMVPYENWNWTLTLEQTESVRYIIVA